MSNACQEVCFIATDRADTFFLQRRYLDVSVIETQKKDAVSALTNQHKLQADMLTHQYEAQKNMLQAEFTRNVTMATQQFEQQMLQQTMQLEQQYFRLHDLFQTSQSESYFTEARREQTMPCR